MSSNEANRKTLEFISDWQKRSEKQQRSFVIVLISTMILTVLISVFGFLWYQDDNYDRTIRHNINYVQDNALQEAHAIEKHMDDNVNIIKKYAKQYAYLERYYPESSVEERINILWDNTLFDRVSYVSEDGELISLIGTANVEDRDYFKDAMQGGSGYLLLDESRITHEPTMLFYSPIYKGDRITGVMLGLHERDRLDRQLIYQFMNYKPKIYLMQGDGKVIGSSNDMYLTENMFEILSKREFRGDADYEYVKSMIDSEEEKTVAFTFLDEGRSSIGVIAQFTEGDMMVLSVLPSEITDTMIAEANNAGQFLMITVSAAFFALVFVFMIFIIRQRSRLKAEMTMATEKLTETYAHDQRQSFIVDSLSNTFSSVYYVDITNHSYERVSEENQMALDTLKSRGNWDESYESSMKSFVREDFRDKMLMFFDLEKCIALMDEGESLSAEYQRPDNEWRRANMITVEKDDDGHIKSVIFAVQKIDAEKRRELDTKKALEEAYEAAKLASNAKTTFLSNISHDIRTPMNAIVGMTAIAGTNLDNKDKIADCLKKINISSKHLLGIINEVLDMSKIETGKVDLNEEAFHLPNLFDELITINQPLVKEKKHTLSIKVNALEHEDVVGDSVRLQQVFTNLLTNAIKYTPDGGRLEIIVSEKQTNKPNVGWYEVVFRDNGIGMTDEFQKNMFEPFSRAKDSRIAGIQGTGLGMPIARNIIRMMNGDIKVESKLNVGSTFTVSFALRLQNQDDLDYSRFCDLSVLVADDDLTACESTCMMLESLSMKSEYVTSGREAVARVVKKHKEADDYYAVILDWQMPDMDGVAAAKAIREQVGSNIPIIVISAYDWTEIEQDARAVGVNAFLSKPLFRSRLVNLFSEITDKGNEADKASEHNKVIKENSFEGRRILLAEDNALNSEIVVELMSMMGLEVDVAENGKLCLEKFVASQIGYYDLIFMDIQMPVMDGYQATAAIRISEHPQAKTIPIVAMSANAFSTDVRNAISSGMNAHISKPIDINAIVNVLEEYLH